MVWDFKEEGSSFMEMEKHMIGKQTFAGICRDNESILDSASLGLGKSLPPHLAHILCRQLYSIL